MRRFGAGQRVRVLDLGKAGHVRIPHYIRNRIGTVVHYCGSYLNPEQLAVGDTRGPAIDLYRVAFDLPEIWATAAGAGTDALPGDSLVIEIYDHWLAPAESIPHQATRGSEHVG